MRYLVGFVFVLAALVALPQSASAQASEEGVTPEPNLQEAAPTSEPASKEPALQLKLDDAGVDVAPGYPPRFDELELRVKQAEIGFFVSTGVFGAGVVLVFVAAVVGAAHFGEPGYDWVDPAVVAGAALLVGGAAGMISSGVVRRKAKRKLRELQRAHYGTPRRVQWDLAQSRVVF